MKKKKRKVVKRYKTPDNCPFCAAKKDPDYKEYKTLEKYISDRAKIFGSVRTGTCAKHQRRLAVAVKRVKQLVPQHPQLNQIFSAFNLDEIIEEVQKTSKPKKPGKLSVEDSLK